MFMESILGLFKSDVTKATIDIPKVAGEIGAKVAENVDLPGINEENEKKAVAIGVSLTLGAVFTGLSKAVPGITVE